MGIYTSGRYLNEAYDYASDVPVNEAYDATFGCAHALAECEINDMALFESAIYSDIAEVRAMQEGYGYVNENAFTDVLKRIKDIFIKLIGKIKGIFASFLTKLTAAFKSGEDLVKKYGTKINSYQNWKGFKCKKIRKPVNTSEGIIESINKLFGNEDATKTGMGSITYKINIKNTGDADKRIAIDTGITEYTSVDGIKEADIEDLKNAILKKHINDCDDIKEITKSVMDKLFEEEATIDDDEVKDGQYFNASWIKGALVDSKKAKEKVEKYNKKCIENINKIIDNLDRDEKAISDYIGKDINDYKGENDSTTFNYGSIGNSSKGKISKTDKFSYDKSKNTPTSTNGIKLADLQKAVQALQKLATNHSEVITTVTNEYMKTYKFAFAQAKKLYTAAAVWSSGVHKESVEFSEAMGDVALEQFYSNMESI